MRVYGYWRANVRDYFKVALCLLNCTQKHMLRFVEKKIDVTRDKKGLCRTSLKLSTGGEYTRLHKHGCKIPAEEKYQIKFAYKTANIVSFKHICTPSLVSVKSHFINYKSFTWLIAQDLRFRAGSNIPRALQVRQKLHRISYKLRGMNIHSQHYEAIFFRFFQTQLCWTYLDSDEFSFTSYYPTRVRWKPRVKRF